MTNEDSFFRKIPFLISISIAILFLVLHGYYLFSSNYSILNLIQKIMFVLIWLFGFLLYWQETKEEKSLESNLHQKIIKSPFYKNKQLRSLHLLSPSEKNRIKDKFREKIEIKISFAFIFLILVYTLLSFLNGSDEYFKEIYGKYFYEDYGDLLVEISKEEFHENGIAGARSLTGFFFYFFIMLSVFAYSFIDRDIE